MEALTQQAKFTVLCASDPYDCGGGQPELWASHLTWLPALPPAPLPEWNWWKDYGHSSPESGGECLPRASFVPAEDKKLYLEVQRI